MPRPIKPDPDSTFFGALPGAAHSAKDAAGGGRALSAERVPLIDAITLHLASMDQQVAMVRWVDPETLSVTFLGARGVHTLAACAPFQADQEKHHDALYDDFVAAVARVFAVVKAPLESANA